MLFSRYRHILQNRSFRYFWLSFTCSALGDSMTHVALTWLVYDLTKSAEALGLLAFTYTAPIIVGGIIAGPILDRFDKCKVMMIDNIFRGTAVLLIPLLYAMGTLELWHIYAVSLVYGTMLMLTLAGSPSLVPELVDEQQLSTANALETLSYTLSGVIGPPIAGLLIPLMSAPNVLIFDVLSYFFFALVLWSIRSSVSDQSDMEASSNLPTFRLSDAISLLINNKILLSTTLMFMAVNLGLGGISVWLPIVADQVLHGDAQLYGLLLGALAVGEVSSSFIAGSIKLPITLGKAIALTQIASGIALAILLLGQNIPTTIIGLGLLGFFSAPLTIWAQTLRMKMIPVQLRGRTFALLRTLMQSTNPVGGIVTGLLLPLVGIPLVIGSSALIVSLSGALGYSVRSLREAD